MKHKLYCDANYYSTDCSVYCVAKDTDADGHFTCDPQVALYVVQVCYQFCAVSLQIYVKVAQPSFIDVQLSAENHFL